MRPKGGIDLTARWLNTIGLLLTLIVLAGVVLIGALLGLATIDAGVKAFVQWVFPTSTLTTLWLNTISLSLGTAGVAIIFIWGRRTVLPVATLIVLACVVYFFGALLAFATINAGLHWVFALPAQWLNTIGLLLGMAGVLIIFRWGPPRPDFDQGVGLGLEDENLLPDGRTVAAFRKDQRRLKRRHDFMSRVGLGLIGLGFFVQLVAVWR